MKGVTIIETDILTGIFTKLSNMEELFKETVKKIEDGGDKWMDAKQTAKYMKKSPSWIYQNKSILGFSKPGADILFNREKVDAYLWSVFYQKGIK